MSSPVAMRAAILACLAVLTECGTVERSLRQASSGREVEVSSDLDKDTADAITDFLAEDANTSSATEPPSATSKVTKPTTTFAPRSSKESTTSSHAAKKSTTSLHKTTTSASTTPSTTSLRRTTTSAAPASTTHAAPASITSSAPASTTSTAPPSTTSTAHTLHSVSRAPASSTAELRKAKKSPMIVRSLLATTPEPANVTEAKQSTTALPEKEIAGLPMADLVDEELTTTTSTTSNNRPAVSLTTTVVPSMADAIKASVPVQKQNSSQHADTDSPSVATMRAEIKAELEKEYAAKFKAELDAQVVKALAKDHGQVTSTSAISSPSTTHISTTTTTTSKAMITTTLTWDELYKWESAHEPATTTTRRHEAHDHARHGQEHQHHVWQRHNYHHRAGLVAEGIAAKANTKPQEVVEHPGFFHRLLQQFSTVEHRVIDLGHLLLAKMGFAHSSSARPLGGHEAAAVIQISNSAVEPQNPVQTAMQTDEQRLDAVSAGDAWASSQEQDGKVEFQASHDPALKNAF